MLERAEREGKRHHSIQFLPVACLETATGLSPNLRFAVQESLQSIVPPRTLTQAKDLASAGDLAVRHLAGHAGAYARIVAACVRTLGLIGGDAAFDALGEYRSDERLTVVSELIRAQRNFERPLFVSAGGKAHLKLSWRSMSHLEAISHLTYLQSLDLSWCKQLTDLTGLAGLTSLQSLDLSWCARIADPTGLAGLTDLQSLNLSGYAQLTDLTGLAGFTSLRSLNISWCVELTDLTGLAGLTGLQSLDLSGCNQLTDLSALGSLEKLRTIRGEPPHLMQTLPADHPARGR